MNTRTDGSTRWALSDSGSPLSLKNDTGTVQSDLADTEGGWVRDGFADGCLLGWVAFSSGAYTTFPKSAGAPIIAEQ